MMSLSAGPHADLAMQSLSGAVKLSLVGTDLTVAVDADGVPLPAKGVSKHIASHHMT